MENFPDFVSTLLNHNGFMFLFWALIASPIALWQVWYFHGKNALSEAELIKISSEFEGINSSYFVFSVVVLPPLLYLSVTLFSPVAMAWIPLIFGIRLFPLTFVIFAAYGIYQALFAIYKGVYPMGKPISYIYDNRTVIRRAAKLQIGISLGVYVALSLLARLYSAI
jgi:hypothetical protein